jgi:hypothetical protein
MMCIPGIICLVVGGRELDKLQMAQNPEAVPVLVAMTDGNGNNRNTVETISEVTAANSNLKARIYSMAFGYGADFNTLQAISNKNWGKAVRISPSYTYYGYQSYRRRRQSYRNYTTTTTTNSRRVVTPKIDAAQQMLDYVWREVGTILARDIQVSVESDQKYEFQSEGGSILASGSEVVVFGSPVGGAASFTGNLKVKTTLMTKMGSFEGSAQVSLGTGTKLSGGDAARKGFVYRRLQALTTEADVLNNYRGRAVALSKTEEARKLAIQSRIVWPGLTAMVTQPAACATAAMQNNTCAPAPSKLAADAVPDAADTVDVSSAVSSIVFAQHIPWAACIIVFVVTMF